MVSNTITSPQQPEATKVLAYITAFEDTSAVKRCLLSLEAQSFPITKILIVDNSSHQPISFIDDQDISTKIDEKIIIKYHPENIGVGGGLEIALEFAKAEKYDFLWTFDQDSIPTPDCLQILIEEYYQICQDNFPIGIIAPTPIDRRTNSVVEGAIFDSYRFIGLKHKHQSNFYECDAPITSGSLIPSTIIDSISPHLADLFIDGVDFELGMQIKQRGFHNLIIPSAHIYHLFGNPHQVIFANQEKTVQIYSALRHYYICRNHTYLELKYAQLSLEKKSIFLVYLWRFKFTLNMILKIYFFDPEDKYQKIGACLLGIYHGLKGHQGKSWK